MKEKKKGRKKVNAEIVDIPLLILKGIVKLDYSMKLRLINVKFIRLNLKGCLRSSTTSVMHTVYEIMHFLLLNSCFISVVLNRIIINTCKIEILLNLFFPDMS